ncbi:MAG TPA: integration host factor subunit alpha [Gammaproteobacteria bacterium]|nr:integration host factor subunit alpha [Gammaproteobacteria bacterium]
MKSLTKAKLASYVEDEVGLEAPLAMALVEHFFEEITVALEKGEEVKLFGLGNFSVRQKNARMARNPRSGESVKIPARKVVNFQTSTTLRKLLNQLSCGVHGA